MGSRERREWSGADGSAPARPALAGHSGAVGNAALRSNPGPDIRALATAAALRSLFFGLLPVPITIGAVSASPSLPYAVGALVSFALVAGCVALAIYYGCRVLRITGSGAVAQPAAQLVDMGRRSAVSIAASAAAGRALGSRRRMGIVGIVLGGLHGLFLLGSLALTIPGMLWLASIPG